MKSPRSLVSALTLSAVGLTLLIGSTQASPFGFGSDKEGAENTERAMIMQAIEHQVTTDEGGVTIRISVRPGTDADIAAKA
ncbi:MAG: hypothetical protein Q8P95_04765, partial [bacterium]|nr:hypothetical protein [bacterium]